MTFVSNVINQVIAQDYKSMFSKVIGSRVVVSRIVQGVTSKCLVIQKIWTLWGENGTRCGENCTLWGENGKL